MKTDDYVIYGLTDPRDPAGIYRYIGCTTQDGNTRRNHHFHVAKSEDNTRSKWITELYAVTGSRPGVVELEHLTDATKSQAKTREDYWISESLKNFHPLTNERAGGGGNTPSSATQMHSQQEVQFAAGVSDLIKF